MAAAFAGAVQFVRVALPERQSAGGHSGGQHHGPAGEAAAQDCQPAGGQAACLSALHPATADCHRLNKAERRRAAAVLCRKCHQYGLQQGKPPSGCKQSIS